MIYRRVLRYYRPFLGRRSRACSFSLVGIGVNLLKPWPFKFIVDQILPQRTPPSARPIADLAPATFRLLCLALVGLQLLWGLINLLTNYIFVKIGLQALLETAHRSLRLSAIAFAEISRRAPLSDSSFRVAYDSQAIQTIYNKGFTNIFGSVITLVGIFVIMLRLDWQLTLLSLGIVPLIVGAIYFFAHRIRTRIDLHPGTGKRGAHAGAGRIELDPHGARVWARRFRSLAISRSARSRVCRPTCGLP